MSPVAIGFDGLIKLIIILSWGTEVILDNQRLHITTSLSETGDATAIWTLAGVGQRDDASTASTVVICVLNLHKLSS
jgi:hypothetical protein